MVGVIVDKAIYVDGKRQECGDDVSAEIARVEAGAGSRDFVWISLKDPSDDELGHIIEQVDMHPLAAEDMLAPRERVKIDHFDGTTVAVITPLQYLERTSDIESGIVKVALSKRCVITVAIGVADPLDEVRRRLRARPKSLRYGPFAVLHAVLDTVVDRYLAIEEELERDLEEIETEVFAEYRRGDAEALYRLKRESLEYRHAVLPLRRPLMGLYSETSRRVKEPELRLLYKDVADHLILAAERAEGHDKLLSDMFSAHIAQLQVRQSEDMRKISAWVAIAAVPTMIAGVYGMNFAYMPELVAHVRVGGHDVYYGYFVVVALMVVVCLILFREFRRRDWL